MTGGWRAQLARVRRWHERLHASPVHDRYDFLYAFFENAFHLRDWLLRTQAVAPPAIEQLFEEHPELRVCRDLANAHKHYSISEPSQQVPPSEAHEWSPAMGNVGEDVSLVILSDGVKYDAVDLADRIMNIWEQFVREHVNDTDGSA